MLVAYAPQDASKKRSLWTRLHDLIQHFQTMTIMLGDFNEVRSESERLGSVFCKSGAKAFNEFIIESDLVDLPMGGVLNKNDNELNDLKAKMDLLEIKAKTGLTDIDIEERLSSLKKVEDLDHFNRLDLMINGIFSNGHWLTDPCLVTFEIYQFYSAKFRASQQNRPYFVSSLFKTLPDFESSLLDAPFTVQEIKNAVWDCGGSKAPGPDGFTSKTYTPLPRTLQVAAETCMDTNHSTPRPSPGESTLPFLINIRRLKLSCYTQKQVSELIERLPTRHNLDAHGIDMHSTRCAICDEDIETTHHLFIDHTLASSIWSSVATCWGLSDFPTSVDLLIKWGDTINLKSGTWLVHTAPGHGPDDYITGLKYGLPFTSPVDDEGKFTEEAGIFCGLDVLGDGNAAVIDHLDERSSIVMVEPYSK
ncbi:RNA-directed DNA polymerase, eukaryota [Tanacetum coccineum]